MNLIYVAGAYSGKTFDIVENNILKAEIASIELFKKGWAVFTPHKNTAHYEELQYKNFNYKFWLEVGTEILRRCDAIFMLKGWEKSKGSVAEKKLAEKLGLDIYFEENGFPEPQSMVNVEINFENNALLELMTDAHKNNITFNRHICNILKKAIKGKDGYSYILKKKKK